MSLPNIYKCFRFKKHRRDCRQCGHVSLRFVKLTGCYFILSARRLKAARQRSSEKFYFLATCNLKIGKRDPRLACGICPLIKEWSDGGRMSIKALIQTLFCSWYWLGGFNNDNGFMAPHLVRAQSAYKNMSIHSFHYTPGLTLPTELTIYDVSLEQRTLPRLKGTCYNCICSLRVSLIIMAVTASQCAASCICNLRVSLIIMAVTARQCAAAQTDRKYLI